MRLRNRRILKFATLFFPILFVPPIVGLTISRSVDFLESFEIGWTGPGLAFLFLADGYLDLTGNLHEKWWFPLGFLISLSFLYGLSIMAANGKMWLFFAIILGLVIGGGSGFVFWLLTQLG
ncbi:MAG: hypothetical protein HKN23_09095 [Verrucomicrobiales bacterium]|nr:hypothetical protein [Verrucomicrobiales bacterium]